MRIEFTERYFEPYTDEQIDAFETMNVPFPKREAKYRRLYMRIDDIFAPKEIPGKKNHCHIETNYGDLITVKGSYDEICQLIDDREELLAGSDELGE